MIHINIKCKSEDCSIKANKFNDIDIVIEYPTYGYLCSLLDFIRLLD